MSIINLDKTFEPFGKGQFYEKFMFPSGCESHIKVSPTSDQHVRLTTRIGAGDDIIELLLATDALKRAGAKEIELFIPYLPYARQDRVMVKGEPLSIKVLADMINSQEYSKVSVFDPHSDVCVALINKSEAISNHRFVEKVLEDKNGYVIVSPDAGAFKKIFKVCQHIDYKHDIVVCSKQRNVVDGSISQIDIPIMDFQGMDLYIIDDICDGGYTFKMLADELRKRNCGNVNLIVSHGIFSKTDLFLKLDHVYTTNSFCDLGKYDNVTQYKLTNGLLS